MTRGGNQPDTIPPRGRGDTRRPEGFHPGDASLRPNEAPKGPPHNCGVPSPRAHGEGRRSPPDTDCVKDLSLSVFAGVGSLEKDGCELRRGPVGTITVAVGSLSSGHGDGQTPNRQQAGTPVQMPGDGERLQGVGGLRAPPPPRPQLSVRPSGPPSSRHGPAVARGGIIPGCPGWTQVEQARTSGTRPRGRAGLPAFVHRPERPPPPGRRFVRPSWVARPRAPSARPLRHPGLGFPACAAGVPRGRPPVGAPSAPLPVPERARGSRGRRAVWECRRAPRRPQGAPSVLRPAFVQEIRGGRENRSPRRLNAAAANAVDP
ncbi:basic salivary proline-rich protein 1-like [Peromyscus leucopus]|uniref:basic salivary proline-rich protein 1-like n=1 Tax=Peromyscus leucopus TaxID=10041 RepID=UPI0010A17909|nr:basic salivary proline-rich protein 1-like [Peromyscus leucopus]